MIRLSFCECEHVQDLKNYVDDVVSCGAKLIDGIIYYDDERGDVIAEVDDYDDFVRRFKVTDSYDFLDGELWKQH